MVGHESVDPKPQEKSDLVYWRDSTTYQTLHASVVVFFLSRNR